MKTERKYKYNYVEIYINENIHIYNVNINICMYNININMYNINIL